MSSQSVCVCVSFPGQLSSLSLVFSGCWFLMTDALCSPQAFSVSLPLSLSLFLKCTCMHTHIYKSQTHTLLMQHFILRAGYKFLMYHCCSFSSVSLSLSFSRLAPQGYLRPVPVSLQLCFLTAAHNTTAQSNALQLQ